MEDITPIHEQVLEWQPKTAKTLRGYLRRLVFVNYLAYWASVLMAMFVLFAIAIYIAGRWTFYDPPYGHPVTLFHCVHALIVLLVLRLWAWPRIRRPLTLKQLADRIERGDRRIRGKKGERDEEDPLEYLLDSKDERLTSEVTSALEFSEPDPILAESLVPSRNILAGTGHTSATKGFFERVLIDLKKRSLWRWVIPPSFWVTLVMTAIVCLLALFLNRFEPFTAEDAWKFYRGNFLANPYRPLHKLLVNPGLNETVLKGESLKVWGSLIGPGTHKAEITYSMIGFPEVTVEMKNNGPPNSFVYEFDNLQSDLTFRVKCGPLESPEHSVKVRIPPELTYIRLTYYYPEFMEKKFELMPAGQGAAIAPLGTTIEVTTKWNQPMERVDIVVNGKNRYPMAQGGHYHKGSFPLDSAGTYVLSGTSTEGVRTRGDLEFPIQALVDLPPEIKWVFPKKDLDFSRTRKKFRKIPLKFRATDDYGLHSIDLYAGAPGKATFTYEVTRLDGKEKEFAGQFDLDLRPFADSPVVRVYFMAVDNHPGIQGRTVTKVRRLYFQAPGTFTEEEGSEKPKARKGNPFEMTANELFALIKMQEEQNDAIRNPASLDEVQKQEWLKKQERLFRLTTQTVIFAKERADRLFDEPSDPEKDLDDLSVKDKSDRETVEGVQDLPVRLELVVKRLSGGIDRIDELQPGKKPTGTSALDRQLRQWDAAQEGRDKRAYEEGKRAYTELEAAFKELTGQDLPVPVEEELEQLAKEEEGSGIGPGDAKGPEREGDEAGDGDKGDEEEGDEGENDSEKLARKKPEEGAETESWVTGKADEESDRFAPGIPEEEKEGGKGEGEAQDVTSGIGPSTPSNKYSPSAYTLDPETVLIDSPTYSLMRKEVSKQLSGIDLSQYRDPEIPKEYLDAAQEYGQVLTGE